MDHIQLTTEKLSVEAVSALVTHESCGAVALFAGTTRDNFKGKKVLRLEYEAYEPMALKALKSLCGDMREKWPELHGIAIYHRLGTVPAGEASVVVAASSPHRAPALAAVDHCLDRLKASVPVWKKEVYDDGSVWKENRELSPARDSPEPIDKSLSQVTVSNAELQQRIRSFMERKREQVDLSNIHDFTPSAVGGGGDSCARTSAVFVRRGDSKCHLKVHRVHNEWGPQTVRASTTPYPTPGHAPRPGSTPPADHAFPPGLRERVTDIEHFLSISSTGGDVYQRIKTMEDRIRHLQSISPEYATFWHKSKESEPASSFKGLDCRYDAHDITKKIEEMERQNSNAL